VRGRPARKAFDRLGLPRKDILAYTLPGFATSDETKTNAHALMRALGTTSEEIDISKALATTISAWVESSPPETPITARFVPVAASRWARPAT
jgi:NH3-dependent NAD+ synthetase